jgi:hypothetical protein
VRADGSTIEVISGVCVLLRQEGAWRIAAVSVIARAA